MNFANLNVFLSFPFNYRKTWRHTCSWRKRRHLVIHGPIITTQGVTPLLSRNSCTASNGRFWNIHRTHLIWVHAIAISSQKWKSHYVGPGTTTRDELIRAIGRSIKNNNKGGRADGVWRFPNIWQKVISKKATVLKVQKCFTSINHWRWLKSEHWTWMLQFPITVRDKWRRNGQAETDELTLLEFSTYFMRN